MARIAGVDLPRTKRVEVGLTYIYGIGRKRSNDILTEAGVSGDVRVAIRRLRRAPLFVLFAAVSIAAGVAITATVYAILYQTFWRPLAVEDPETLMVLAADDLGFTRWRSAISRADADVYAGSQQSFAALAVAAPVPAAAALGEAQTTALLTAVNGQYFIRWIDDFNADGPLPLSSTYDNGFELSAIHFVLPKKLGVYGRGSAVNGQFGDAWEYAGGLKFYPVRSERMWLNAEVMNVHKAPYTGTFTPYVAGLNGWVPMVQALLAF